MTAEEEAQAHLEQAAVEDRKAAEILRQRAKDLDNHADENEQNAKGGSTSSWNPFS